MERRRRRRSRATDWESRTWHKSLDFGLEVGGDDDDDDNDGSG